jgi:hypothetical protein
MKYETMKLHHLLIVTAAFIALPACERNKTASEKIKDGVNDAFDRRPGEKVRDAAEDTKDAVKEAGKDIKDAVKDSTK